MAIALHLSVALAALWALRRTVFLNVGVDDSIGAAAAEKKNPALTRDSRRAWDDALAWLCYAVHANGRRTLKTKTIVYFLMALLLLAMPLAPSGLLLTFMVVSPPVVASIASFKVGDCLVRELKGQTLSTLALLPFSEMEVYRGWKRGAMRLAVPDLLYIAWAMFIMFGTVSDTTFPFGARLCVAALCGAILLATPFFFLNNLLSFEPAFIPIGCLSVLIVIGTPILAGIVAATVSPAAGMALFVISTITAHFVFTALIPGNFRRRIERVS
jgi:hypothetical protein